MKIISLNISAILLSSFLLIGCDQAIIRTTQNRVITPPEQYYECPITTVFPNPDMLTDIQVGQLLVELYRNNTQCKTNIEAIRTFMNEARRTVEETQPSE